MLEDVGEDFYRILEGFEKGFYGKLEDVHKGLSGFCSFFIVQGGRIFAEP